MHTLPPWVVYIPHDSRGGPGSQDLRFSLLLLTQARSIDPDPVTGRMLRKLLVICVGAIIALHHLQI